MIRPFDERALALAETAYGPEHPYVGIALHNLAGILWERSVISLLPARWPNGLRDGRRCNVDAWKPTAAQDGGNPRRTARNNAR